MSAPLPLPIAEYVGEQVLVGVRAERLQRRHPGLELLRQLVRGQLGVSPVVSVISLLHQPVPQRPGRPHIVGVVVGDPVERGLVTIGHELLVGHHGPSALPDVLAPLVARQHLKVFQPVRLNAHLHAVADDGQQVDERTGAHQFVQQQLTYPVLTGEAFQGGPLGVVVVVHVHARPPPPSLGQVLDQLANLLTFLVQVVGPAGVVGPCAPGSVSRIVAAKPAKQEEQSARGSPERVALEVEKHVAVVGLRQLFVTQRPG